MDIDILKIINRFSGVPGIIFFILFLWNARGNTRIVFYILLASFIADLSNFFFIRFVYPNSYIISNVWFLTNYFLVSWIFYKMLSYHEARKRAIYILGGIFLVGSILSFLFFYSFLESNTFIRTFSSLAFTLFSISVFFEILKESPTNKLSNYPVFWVVVAIFLFSSTTLLKNLFQNYLVFELKTSKELFVYLSAFTRVFNITKNLMFFYSFILVKKGFQDYIHPPKKIMAS